MSDPLIHEDDSYGGCTVCRFYSGETDDGEPLYVSASWPCPYAARPPDPDALREAIDGMRSTTDSLNAAVADWRGDGLVSGALTAADALSKALKAWVMSDIAFRLRTPQEPT